MRHEIGLSRWQIRSEILREILWIHEEITVGGFYQGSAAVWEFPAIAGFSLARLRCMGGDINQSGNFGVPTCFGDHGPAVTMSNQYGRTILKIEYPPGSGNIVL